LTLREFEAGLRDAFGLSRKQARKLALFGWRAFRNDRDDPTEGRKELVRLLRRAVDLLQLEEDRTDERIPRR
jgi:hypothetical protein